MLVESTEAKEATLYFLPSWQRVAEVAVIRAVEAVVVEAEKLTQRRLREEWGRKDLMVARVVQTQTTRWAVVVAASGVPESLEESAVEERVE
jgi:hypothetical protein